MGAVAMLQRGTIRTLVLSFMLVVALILTMGWCFYQHARKRVEQEARENLMFIDRLKGEQLDSWQRQRRSDAAFITKNTVNDHHLAPFLENPSRTVDRELSQSWLGTILRDSFYRSVVLVDTNGQARLSLGPADLNLTAEERDAALRVALSGERLFDKIRIDQATGRLYTELYVPVLRCDTDACIGVMMLEIDPEDFLFPLLRSWPRATRSGETEVVERDGGDILVMSTRTREAGAFAPRRVPLTETNRPSVMAVNGYTGLVECVDYRGKEVLAALRPVPGAPWCLVAKIDRDEILAPLRRETLIIVAGAMAMLVLISLILFGWLRRREAGYYRQQLESELERRRQETKSFEQRRFFERIFEQTLAGYWDWDIPEKRLVMSPRLKSMLGYTDEEIPNTQEAWQQLVHPDDMPMLVKAFEKHVQSHGEEPYNIEVRYRHKDGSVIWVICAGLVVEWGAAGQPLRMVGCHTDLTARRQAEEALRKSEARFLDLVNHAPIPMAVAGKADVILSLNEVACKLFGYAADKMPTLQEWWQKAYPDPEYRGVIAQAWALAVREAAANNGIIKPIEAQITCRDGSVRTMEVSGVVEAENRLVMFVDVTERNAAEKVLRESEERLHTLTEASFEGIVILDQGVIVDCNQRFAEMFGGRREEVVGRNVVHFMLPEEADSILARMRSDTEDVIEAHARRLDGSVISVEAKGRRLSRGGRTLRIEAIRDITAHKELEAELEQRVRERTGDLQRSNRALQMTLACNREVLQAQVDNELLKRICATIVTVGGYKMAWVGYAMDDAGKSVKPVAHFGDEGNFLAEVSVTWADNVRGRGPAGKAIRTGTAVVCRDTQNDPDFAPWHEQAMKCGFASCLALPLALGGRVEGALVCYANHPFAFDVEEVRLLSSLVDDLAFGIQALRTRHAHEQAQKELARHRDHLEEEIKLRTEELRQSEAKLRSLFAAMTDVIIILDKEGRYLEIAPTSPDLLFRPPDEILGKTLHEVFPADVADFFLRHVRDALSTRAPVTMEYSLPIMGKQVWFMATLSALSADKVILVARNITARKSAELGLRASEARFRALFSSSSDGIFLHQFNDDKTPSRFLDVSDQGCLMLGYSREELLRMSPVDLRGPHAAKGFAEIYEELVERKRCRYESSLVAKDGHPLFVEINSALFDLDQRPTVVASVRDITERKKFEAELRLAKEAAESTNRAKSDFLANMSHELRTPLNAVIGFSEILSDQTFGPVNPKQAHYLDNILQAGRHLLSLINDILDLSKVEAGKMRMDLQPLVLSKVTDQVFELTHSRALKHGLSMKLVVPPDLAVTADERMLKQILFNLLTNAIKFTPSGGEIRVCAERLGGDVRISVSDTGIGIKAQDQERVFGQFEQVHSSLSRRHQGTGLGLALSRQFVEMHGGRIWVESDGEGHGSTFHFTLPAQPPCEQANAR